MACILTKIVGFTMAASTHCSRLGRITDSPPSVSIFKKSRLSVVIPCASQKSGSVWHSMCTPVPDSDPCGNTLLPLLPSARFTLKTPACSQMHLDCTTTLPCIRKISQFKAILVLSSEKAMGSTSRKTALDASRAAYSAVTPVHSPNPT